ncbi:response regulator [Aestuariimicrobium kwangyangense]|uniref:response regulator n=1 Tax=Aestuariimicrobium kwangyangense TaxID=396389 RepID=UPI0003B3EA02|nr:response regulator transcription factor [Aestuariimicrobium kwangyangense]
MIRIVLVDDHPVVRQGLQALLRSEPDLDVVAGVATAREALAAVDTHAPDLVLTDLRLGDLTQDGVWLAGQLSARVPVLVLTTYDHDRDIVRAVEAGASGYLLKDASPERIIEAVRAAAMGHDVFSPEQTVRVTATLRGPRVEVSDRELEVLCLVAQGATNRQIAKHLFVTEATVKTHLVRAFSKLGVDSRTGAVARARELGLLR